jgi:Putative MetA-pathway of phenol degradation
MMLRALLLSSMMSLCVFAQTPEGPIQDNSFLIEEAYNQEAGVVQHINTFARYRQSKDWVYTFTQEWPVGGLKHQLSYSLPLTKLGDYPNGGAGAGDVALNYRYQLLGDGEAKFAISPRFTVLLPTGDEKKGRGAGATSYQINVPLSWVLTKTLVSHWNLGATYVPKAKNSDAETADLNQRNAGLSLVWLARDRFNLMLEYVWNQGESVAGPGQKEKTRSAFISPGIRWAYNFPSGLQIVPGIAFPIGVGPSREERAIFFYLSFEHPFGKRR